MDLKIPQLLIFLIKTRGKQCPPSFLFPVNQSRLISLAARNKATPFLFHFLTCKSCHQRLSQHNLTRLANYRKFAILAPAFYEAEKKKLGAFCKRNSFKVVAMKDIRVFGKLKKFPQNQTSVDVDLLVEETALPKIEAYLRQQGYRLSNNLKLKDTTGAVYYQEKNYAHRKKPVNFDLHLQLAIPHLGQFSALSPENINQITQETRQSATYQRRVHFFIPTKEYYLFSLITHYVGSDVLRGLRNLYDIRLFVSVYENVINWRQFFRLTRRFKLYTASLFILWLGAKVYHLPLPKTIKHSYPLPFRLKLLLSYWSLEKIAIFPPVEKWNIHKRRIEEMLYEAYFIKFFLNDQFKWTEAFQPRIALFLAQTIFHYLGNKGFLGRRISRRY